MTEIEILKYAIIASIIIAFIGATFESLLAGEIKIDAIKKFFKKMKKT